MTKAREKIANMAKKVKEKVTKAWTEVGDGTVAPEETDAYHSGDYEAMLAKTDAASKSITIEEPVVCTPAHKWKRGMLPGNMPIKTCLTCLKSEKITMEEWVTLT